MKDTISAETSLLRLPEISRPILVLGALFLFALGFVFFIEQTLRPPCCDAKQYVAIAKQYNAEGIAAVSQRLRTFAYPWIVSLLIKVGHLINFPEIFLLFLVQLSTYYLATVVVSNVFAKCSRKVSTAVYVALCVNIFVIPYTSITLTDSLYTSLAILLLAGVMNAEFLQKSGQSFPAKLVFWGMLLLSFTIVIRPAAVWLAAPFFYCLVRSLWKRSLGITDVLLGVILGAAPLYVQIFLNVKHYHLVSFLPAQDLGAMQIRWGIENIKYGTWLGGGNAQNFYPSANLVDLKSEELNLWWYLNNPVDTVKLLLFKLIGAFDFDYLMPYPYSQPTYKWIVSFFSFSIFWAGIFGVFLHLCTNKLAMLGSRFMPFIIFSGWCAVSLASALELRFTLPLISYFIIVGCMTLNFIMIDKGRRILSFMIVGWIIFMPLAYEVAKFIRLQSTILN